MIIIKKYTTVSMEGRSKREVSYFSFYNVHKLLVELLTVFINYREN